MSYQSQLDKDRVTAYCSQCYKKIRLQCPECVNTKKIKRQCRIYKTPASLWWHIKVDHGYFANSQFNTNDVCKVLNNIVKAITWGMIPFER